jgi:hypothetical protein
MRTSGIFRIAPAVILFFCAAAGLTANTVMISYDLILDMQEQLAGSGYIQRTSVDVETGVMNELYDRGHIVFNYPGDIHLGDTSAPEGEGRQTMLIKRSTTASEGGADIMIYLSLHYEGETEEDLNLTALDYQVYRVRGERQILLADSIAYEQLDGVRINGEEASRILFNRIERAGIF